MTNDLQRRVYEHKNNLALGFTSRYRIDRLVYFEETGEVQAAIAREKQLKGWLRAKKVALIESVNPTWEDLSAAKGLLFPPGFASRHATPRLVCPRLYKHSARQHLPPLPNNEDAPLSSCHSEAIGPGLRDLG